MMGKQTTRSTAIKAALLFGAAALGVGLACIIPDNLIQVVITDANDYPVRFVEGIPLDKAARCACSSSPSGDSCECPMASATGLPTYLQPEVYEFCICSEDKVDDNRLYGVQIYVEDQDEVDGAPIDSLYAAALLDWDPTLDESPFDYVAYRSYLDPRKPLDLYYIDSYENGIIKRPRPYVRAITLTDLTGRFDLCNAAGVPIAPGHHTLTLIVTDRPWFTTEGDPIDTTDAGDGDPLEVGSVTLDGVPDISAGATYDLRTYVFHCYSESDEQCACMEPSSEG